MLTSLLERLERRVGRHRGLRNLMTIIVIGMVIVLVADILLPVFANGMTLSSWLRFSKPLILKGQIWRLITFVFIPMESSNLFFFAISLYFFWLMGQQLQNYWGTFRFTVFYTTGMLGAVIAGCITGYTTSYYLNASLLLAMACILPNMQLRLYGIINIRLKWLALLSVVMMVLPLIGSSGWQQPTALAASLINVILFFLDRMIREGKQMWRHYQWKRNWRSGWRR